MQHKNFSYILLGSSLLVCSFLSACLPMDDGTYSNGGGNRDPYGGYDSRYDGPTYDRYDYDRYDYERDQLRRERDELERERRRLEDERRRQERYDQQHPVAVPRLPAAPPVIEDRCPPGWRDGSKCTSSERKRGCKDKRTASGRLCVSGNY